MDYNVMVSFRHLLELAGTLEDAALLNEDPVLRAVAAALRSAALEGGQDVTPALQPMAVAQTA